MQPFAEISPEILSGIGYYGKHPRTYMITGLVCTYDGITRQFWESQVEKAQCCTLPSDLCAQACCLAPVALAPTIEMRGFLFIKKNC